MLDHNNYTKYIDNLTQQNKTSFLQFLYAYNIIPYPPFIFNALRPSNLTMFNSEQSENISYFLVLINIDRDSEGFPG